jgi:hypothetical protein
LREGRRVGKEQQKEITEQQQAAIYISGSALLHHHGLMTSLLSPLHSPLFSQHTSFFFFHGLRHTILQHSLQLSKTFYNIKKWGHVGKVTSLPDPSNAEDMIAKAARFCAAST